MKPKLSTEVTSRLEAMFHGEARNVAESLLHQNITGERLQIAVLKCSHGSLDELQIAVDLAKIDFRDVLMNAGFGHDVNAHLKWFPAQGTPDR